MKIAFISIMTAAPWGGSEELWSATAQYALQKGDKILISVYDQMESTTQIQNLVKKGAQLHTRVLHQQDEAWPSLSQRAINFFKRKLIPTKPARFAFQEILDFQPDVLCISQGDTYSAALDKEVVQLVQSRIPYILISQFNREVSVFQNIDIITSVRNFCLQANHFLFVSDRNRQIAQRQLFSILPNSSIIDNPLNNITCRDIIPYPAVQDTYQMACVARLETVIKGQDLLLAVLAQPKWKIRKWRLNFYGKGPSLEYLKSLAAQLDIDDKVIFHGQVQDIRGIWATNHIKIMPSINEGTPLSLVEAMICGRTAVVTDVGDNSRLVGDDEKRGFLAEAPTFKYFSAAMERAWQNRSNWDELGIRAHNYISMNIDSHPEKTLYNYIIACTNN
jgi:glycosyltransferase involved in cell wall biosynthesis